ncbi:MAG: riboflavin kinase [Minisyncoccia bacterium]
MKYSGTVQKGEGTGRRFGFPTVNISLTDDSLSGIYVAKVRFTGEEWNAAAYVDTKRKLLEAHILNFNDDLYGMEIEIELVKKIREDKKFENEEEAKAAIAEDVAAVATYFRDVN